MLALHPPDRRHLAVYSETASLLREHNLFGPRSYALGAAAARGPGGGGSWWWRSRGGSCGRRSAAPESAAGAGPEAPASGVRWRSGGLCAADRGSAAGGAALLPLSGGPAAGPVPGWGKLAWLLIHLFSLSLLSRHLLYRPAYCSGSADSYPTGASCEQRTEQDTGTPSSHTNAAP